MSLCPPGPLPKDPWRLQLSCWRNKRNLFLFHSLKRFLKNSPVIQREQFKGGCLPVCVWSQVTSQLSWWYIKTKMRLSVLCNNVDSWLEHVSKSSSCSMELFTKFLFKSQIISFQLNHNMSDSCRPLGEISSVPQRSNSATPSRSFLTGLLPWSPLFPNYLCFLLASWCQHWVQLFSFGIGSFCFYAFSIFPVAASKCWAPLSPRLYPELRRYRVIEKRFFFVDLSLITHLSYWPFLFKSPIKPALTWLMVKLP